MGHTPLTWRLQKYTNLDKQLILGKKARLVTFCAGSRLPPTPLDWWLTMTVRRVFVRYNPMIAAG